MIEKLSEFGGSIDPLTEFALIMVLILFVPRLFERLGLPGLIGLVLGGILLGPFGLGIATADRELTAFLSGMGKLMVMFFAGMEIDLEEFYKRWRSALGFGVTTFLFPLLVGLIISRMAGFRWNASIIIGSLLASHTLIAIPIILRYKLGQNRAVMTTMGATIFTDTAALLVLAICLPIHTSGFSISVILFHLFGLAIYVPLLLFGVERLGKFFLNRVGESEDNKTLFMLAIMAIAAGGAELIHLEGIIGAFLAGLAVGGVVRSGPVRERLDTLGNTLFIPMFFIMLGALIDPTSFMRMSLRDYGFMLSIVSGLIFAKWLAARVTCRIAGYSHVERTLMWSLSLPQVAATMAAALVAYQTINSAGERLISERVLDIALVLMMVTVILGPIITERAAKKLTAD